MGNCLDVVSFNDIKQAFTGIFTGIEDDDLPRVLGECLIKITCGYRDSYSAMSVCRELGLLTQKWNITKKGKQYMYYYFMGAGHEK